VSLYYSRKRAFIGDGQCAIAQLRRPFYQFVGVRGAAQEAVAAEAMKFGVV
jgi:hypothetical protein